MADDVDRLVDQLMPQLMPEFRKAAHAIIAATLQWERDRVVELIRPTTVLRPAPFVNTSTFGQAAVRQHPAGYGAVSAPIRNALDILKHRHPQGISISATMGYLRQHQFNLTEAQVRAALKQMAKTGTAQRAARGLYLPPPDPEADREPGVGAPGPENHEKSVEAADDGSKGGGT
jgi:hypothetical protein